MVCAPVVDTSAVPNSSSVLIAVGSRYRPSRAVPNSSVVVIPSGSAYSPRVAVPKLSVLAIPVGEMSTAPGTSVVVPKDSEEPMASGKRRSPADTVALPNASEEAMPEAEIVRLSCAVPKASALAIPLTKRTRLS